MVMSLDKKHEVYSGEKIWFQPILCLLTKCNFQPLLKGEWQEWTIQVLAHIILCMSLVVVSYILIFIYLKPGTIF